MPDWMIEAIFLFSFGQMCYTIGVYRGRRKR